MSARLLLVSLTGLVLAGCGSSPQTHYFTLAQVPAHGDSQATPASPVKVASVNLPASLDRTQIVRSTGANTVDVSDQDRWAAPLGEMARRVLSQDLAAQLAPDKVVLPDSPSPPGTQSIVVSVTEFGADAGGKVVLTGSWTVVNADGKVRLRRAIDLETQSAAGTAGQVAAMSHLVGQLATQITTALRQDRA